MKQNNQNQTPSTPGNPKKGLTEEQRIKRKKMLVYPLMFLLFASSMWFIFAPSAKDKEKKQEGQSFNTDMPLPTDAGIIGDKQAAYEQAQMEEKQQERSSAMQDLASLFGEGKEAEKGNDDLVNTGKESQPAYTSNGGTNRPRQTIQTSASAYRDINRTLGNFYEKPKDDSRKDELQQRIDELEKRMAPEVTTKSTMNDQIALLEKSYELAAKYAGQTGQPMQATSFGERTHAGKGEKGSLLNEKTVITPVRQVTPQLVSALVQPVSETAFVAAYSQSRNTSFCTSVGNTVTEEKNTISACVHGDQTITDGQAVRLRILEPMSVKGTIVPSNTIVIGTTKIQGERLDIAISSLGYRGTVTPVSLLVLDSDGQKGIFIPNSMESSAAKEVAANMGSSLESSINISTNAGAQLASDLGKGVLQGTSQYIAKKMRTVRVHLKAGYRVMLYQPEE